ncbi:MAG TPA: hypothetical protein VKW78_00220 [Terriglobales bacterium]|nr:hypothetical protein [Terriglobales bacterium]
MGLMVASGAEQQSLSKAPVPQPTRTIDLRQFGYLHPVAERDQWSYELLSDPVLFLDGTHLAASFLVANPHPGLSFRDNPFGSPVLFHTTDIDLNSGKAVWARSWGNDSTSEALLQLNDGKLLVQSSYLLSILGPDLKPLLTRQLEYAGDTLAQPFLSTSGRTLFLVQPTAPQSTIALLDPERLRVMKQYAVPKVVTFSGSDEYIAYAVEEGYFGNITLRVQSLTGGAPELPFARGNCYGYSPKFLSIASLVITGGCPNFTYVDLQKQDIWQQKLPKPSGTELRTARDAPRFAFELVEHHENTPATPLEVDVFDVEKRAIIFKLKIDKPGQRFSFALSPDGKKLAILQSPMVSVYELPE